MTRPLRLELAGGLYHVTSRGDRRELIYDTDKDRDKWLEILGNVCTRYNWRCHAYCLMKTSMGSKLQWGQTRLISLISIIYWFLFLIRSSLH